MAASFPELGASLDVIYIIKELTVFFLLLDNYCCFLMQEEEVVGLCLLLLSIVVKTLISESCNLFCWQNPTGEVV